MQVGNEASLHPHSNSHSLIFTISLPHLSHFLALKPFYKVLERGCACENTNKQNLIENQVYKVRLVTRFAAFFQS